jgi:hypothetical protein
VHRDRDLVEDRPHLAATEHHRQLLVVLRLCKAEDLPLKTEECTFFSTHAMRGAPDAVSPPFRRRRIAFNTLVSGDRNPCGLRPLNSDR